MSKLEWDKVGEKYYETGTDRGVLYPQTGASNTYGQGVAWNGLTGITESPGGAEATDLYADNIKYGSMRSAETFGGTIEAYTYPDEFEQCDGTREISEGIIIGQQNRVPFGLSYRTMIGNDTATEEDDGYKIHLIYGATASPSEKAYSTINDSPEAITFSWEFDTTPVNVDGFKPTSHLILDTRRLNASQVAAIEKVLYGDEATEPKLPLPDEVVSIITTAKTSLSGMRTSSQVKVD